MCDNPVMLPSNRQMSNILTEHTVRKLFLGKNSQNIEILVAIHRNVFPCQPTPVIKKSILSLVYTTLEINIQTTGEKLAFSLTE